MPLHKAHDLTVGVRDFEWQLGYVLCLREDITPELLDYWAWKEGGWTAGQICQNPITKLETVMKCAKSSDYYVVASAIHSGRLPQPVVEEFADSNNVRVRQAVAKVSTNPAILGKLAEDADPEVRVAAVLNRLTDASIVDDLALKEENLDVLACVAKRLTDTKLLDAVAGKQNVKHAALSKDIMENPNSSDAAKVAAVLWNSH